MDAIGNLNLSEIKSKRLELVNIIDKQRLEALRGNICHKGV